QCGLAMEAALTVVGDVLGTLALVGDHLEMGESVRTGEAPRLLLLARGEAGRHRRHREGALPENAVRHVGQERRVGPARVAHDEPLVPADGRLQADERDRAHRFAPRKSSSLAWASSAAPGSKLSRSSSRKSWPAF